MHAAARGVASQAVAQARAGEWRGGVNTTALSMLEQRAYGWYHYYAARFNLSNASAQVSHHYHYHYHAHTHTHTHTHTHLAPCHVYPDWGSRHLMLLVARVLPPAPQPLTRGQPVPYTHTHIYTCTTLQPWFRDAEVFLDGAASGTLTGLAKMPCVNPACTMSCNLCTPHARPCVNLSGLVRARDLGCSHTELTQMLGHVLPFVVAVDGCYATTRVCACACACACARACACAGEGERAWAVWAD